ncbi:MAG: regulatory protein RecX [Salinibacter sp.]
MPRRLAAFLIVVLALGGHAYAQDGATVQVQASAEPTTVGAEGRVTYTLRVDGGSRAAVETPSPPSTRNLVLQLIRRDLEQHGVATASIEAALEAANPDWDQLARETRQRRFGEAPPADWNARARQSRFLEYRGFTGEQIRKAMR